MTASRKPNSMGLTSGYGPVSAVHTQPMRYVDPMPSGPRDGYSANTSCRVMRTTDRVLAVTTPSRLTRRILSTVLI
jgi:hypothetical protein